MKVAKGSYYNHIFRNKNKNTKFEEKKRELAPIIEKTSLKISKISSKYMEPLKYMPLLKIVDMLLNKIHCRYNARKRLVLHWTRCKKIYYMNHEQKIVKAEIYSNNVS